MNLWGFDWHSGTFRKYDVDNWRNEITVDGAVRYLIEQLKQSIIDDFETAYFAYLEKGTGFFGCMRILCPNITFLGALYMGEDTSRAAVEFIRIYLGQVNEEYQNLGDVFYAIYRHGLAHTNMPKIITVNDKDVGWILTLGNEPHLVLSSEGLKDYNIWISPYQLYKDMIKGIDIYINDLKNSDDNTLFSNFKQGYIEMAKYHNRRNIGMRCDFGFKYIAEKIRELNES